MLPPSTSRARRAPSSTTVCSLITLAFVGVSTTALPSARAADEESLRVPASALTDRLIEDQGRTATDLTLLRRLIDGGANVDYALAGDGTPLIIASRRGDVELVRLLLEKGASINQFSSGDGSPLIAASAGGHLEVVKMLVSHGATVDAHDAHDESPLINAARRGHLDVVTYLLSAGADASLSVVASTIDGAERRSPISEARKHGHHAVVRLLAQHGATS